MTNEQGGRSLVLLEIWAPPTEGVGEPLNPANLTTENNNTLHVSYNGVPTEIHRVPTNFKLYLARWLDDIAGVSQSLDLDRMTVEEHGALSIADLLREATSQKARELPIKSAVFDVAARYGELTDRIINIMQVQKLIAELVEEARGNFVLTEAESRIRWRSDEVINATQQLYWSGYYDKFADRLRELSPPGFDPSAIYT